MKRPDDNGTAVDDRVSNPLATGLRSTALAFLVAIPIVVLWKLPSLGAGLDDLDGQLFFWLSGGVVGVVALLGFGHAYLGAHIGRKRAATVIKTVVAALALLGLSIGALVYNLN